jgi:hypothetical protein
MKRKRFYLPSSKMETLRHFPTRSQPSRRSADCRRSVDFRLSGPPLKK